MIVLPGLLFLVGCGKDKKKPAAQSSSSAAPSTTAAPAGPVYPLTGLPAPGGVPGRPAVSVKIDNVAGALPQSGLNNADIVYEALVEGGQTRLFATYHSQDADPVGPIRSARPVDADLLSELGGGIFAYSGAAPGEIAPVEDHSGATLLSFDSGNPAFHRDNSKPAPHNVYSSTAALYQAGAEAGDTSKTPPQQFQYGVSTGRPVITVKFVMGERASGEWHWNAGASQYERDQNGEQDVLDDGSRVSATNVLLMSVKIEGSGVFDTVGEEDPYVIVIGGGPCWLLRDGQLIEGRWSRTTPQGPTTFTALNGTPMLLHPGRTWVELVPEQNTPPTFE